MSVNGSLYEFGPFRLDPSQEMLAEGTRKVALTPKAFKTLLVLVENRGRTLSKDELLQKVWPDAFVEEATLAQNIFTLRKVLRDDREAAQYIETLPKRGYRFVAEVREVKPATPSIQQVQPRSRFAPTTVLYTLILTGVFAAVLGGWYWVRSKPAVERPVPGANTKPRTLAVLPFRGLPGNSAEASWGIGMTRAAYLRELFGDVDGAYELMEMAFEATPPTETEDRAWILSQMGHLRFIAGRTDEAETLLKQALSIFPGYHYALANLAKVRIVQKRYDEAVTLLHERYGAASHAENLYDLAEALHVAGRESEAHQDFAEFEKKSLAESARKDNSDRELIFYYADYAKDPAKALHIAEQEHEHRRDANLLRGNLLQTSE